MPGQVAVECRGFLLEVAPQLPFLLQVVAVALLPASMPMHLLAEAEPTAQANNQQMHLSRVELEHSSLVAHLPRRLLNVQLLLPQVRNIKADVDAAQPPLTLKVAVVAVAAGSVAVAATTKQVPVVHKTVVAAAVAVIAMSRAHHSSRQQLEDKGLRSHYLAVAPAINTSHL